MLDRLKKLLPEQLRRDVGMIVRGLRGQSPPPFTSPSSAKLADAQSPRFVVEEDTTAPTKTRAVPPTPPSAISIEGRRLQIAEVKRETPNAVTLVLEDPFGAPIPFQAGQFFTVTWPPRSRPGVTSFEKRAYSVSCSAVDTTRVSITVKRVADGRVSSAIHASAAVGEAIEVLGPSGNFTVPEGSSELVLIGGGSGITPLMSIARTELETRAEVRISLVFGNKNEEEIIFAEDIQELEAAHGDRFRVRHALETPGERVRAARGKLDEETLRAEIDALSPGERAVYFLCGPEPMMTAAERLLTGRGVPKERIKIERFSTLRRADTSAGADHEATVIISKKKHPLRVAKSETLLEAGLRAGLDMPFSCTVGGCGACRVYLHEGKVAMDEPNCLSDDEAREGYVLACVSRLSASVTVEVE